MLENLQAGPLRVAAYCRVSTDKEDQLHSLDAQETFFLEYIRSRVDWASVGIFADEGLSGTSTRRPRFQDMIRRAMEGEIDLILTKEVSRFARNTVDTLQITRQLKERQVGVLFLNDNIDTRESDGEFRLTIMASVAQEESRKISQRTRWGQTQAMKRGVVFGNDSLYGYHLREGKLQVRADQADVVRDVFRKFLQEGKGTYVIARELTQAGIVPPMRPEGEWSSTMVLRILRNEKYCGDLLQRKYRTTDHLTHRKVPNHGEEEQFCLRNHHEAIIRRDAFEAAQAELARRGALAGEGRKFSARYWYSGKIRCGDCGGNFSPKRTRRADGSEYCRFVCRGRVTGSRGCHMRSVNETYLLACVQTVVSRLGLDREKILKSILDEAVLLKEGRGEEKLRQSIQRQQARRERALEVFLDGDLSREQWQKTVARCAEELERLQERMTTLQSQSKAINQDGLRARLEQELMGGSGVLSEAVGQIVVESDHLMIRVADWPVGFQVRAQWDGREFRVVECQTIPWENS